MPFLTVSLRAPDACTAALASPAAPGNVDNGTHSYKVTFVNAQGETDGGTLSNPVTVADKTANGQVQLTQIPLGDGTVTSRKIYRTVAGNAAPWKLVATLADNTTKIYTDNTADASLGASEPATNGTALTIDVATDEASKDEVEIGDATRAIDGSYCSTVTARKRDWSITTPAMLRADADTLEARLKGAGPMPCAGDLLGGTVSCFPELTRWDAVAVSGGHRVKVGVTLHEAGGSGSSIIVSDTFTRADSATTLGSADTGHAWTAYAGTWGISTNRAYQAAFGTDAPVAVDSGRADCTVRVTLAVIQGITAAVGLTFRLSDASNWFRLVMSSDSLVLQKNTAGSLTVVTSVAVTRVDGMKLKVILAGSGISCYADDVLKFTVSDSHNATATRHGLNVHSNNVARLDDFFVEA